jgi:hypothetical protein
MHTIMTAKLMSLYIVVTAALKAAVCALAHKSKMQVRASGHPRSGGHKADVTSQPTNAARRWASTSTAVLGSAGNWRTVAS